MIELKKKKKVILDAACYLVKVKYSFSSEMKAIRQITYRVSLFLEIILV